MAAPRDVVATMWTGPLRVARLADTDSPTVDELDQVAAFLCQYNQGVVPRVAVVERLAFIDADPDSDPGPFVPVPMANPPSWLSPEAADGRW